MVDGFEGMARAVFEGTESFDDFARATAERWRRLAGMILRRWTQPEWVTLEDVVQDLLVGAWEAIWKWDARRTPRLTPYLTWNAVDKAKKRAHRARGAVLHRGTDRNPGRAERAMCTMSEATEEQLLRSLTTRPDQDIAIEWSEMVDRARGACRTTRELKSIEALATEQSVWHGAARLFADPESRLELRLSSEEHAQKVVVRAAMTVADRLEGREA